MKDKENILKIINDFDAETAVELIKALLEDADPLKMGKIMKILNVFETGTLKQDYSSVFVYNDGPNKIKQITLGKGLTEFGNLPELIKNYSEANGIYSDSLKKYVGRIGSLPSLHGDSQLLDILNKAGSDPVMQKEQDKIFSKRYWEPAMSFFETNKFTEPLSLLVIADSTLHSGSVPYWIRRRFSERPPALGGDERKWISSYVKARHDWLWSKGGLLRNTVYRTNCFKEQISRGNWDLSEPVSANGILVE